MYIENHQTSKQKASRPLKRVLVFRVNPHKVVGGLLDYKWKGWMISWQNQNTLLFNVADHFFWLCCSWNFLWVPDVCFLNPRRRRRFSLICAVQAKASSCGSTMKHQWPDSETILLWAIFSRDLALFCRNLYFWALFSRNLYFWAEIFTSEHFSLEISTSEISITSEHFSLEISTSEHFPLAQRRKPTTQSHLETTITMRFATPRMHFPLAQRRHHRASAAWNHHYNAIRNTLHALPPSTAPQTHHPKPSRHRYNAICNSLNALPPSTAPPSPSQRHLKPTTTMRFATPCMHFPLAQRRKPTTQSHLDTVTMRFATL